MDFFDSTPLEISRPKFRLNFQKFIFLLQSLPEKESELNHTKITHNRPLSSNITNHGYKNKGRLDGIGTLHFHNETLRHNHGEFTMNRILSTPKQNSNKSTPKEQKRTIKKIKVNQCKNINQLITRTQTLLSGKNKQSFENKILKGNPLIRDTDYRVKSREYINTHNIEKTS